MTAPAQPSPERGGSATCVVWLTILALSLAFWAGVAAAIVWWLR